MDTVTVRGCLLLTFAATLVLPASTAQVLSYSPPPHFDHIVIIIQENRTPDDLFGGAPFAPSSACGGFNGFTPYIDLANGGANNYTSSAGGHKGCSFLTAVPDLNQGGGNHSNKDWQGQWDKGAMDGACNPVTDPTANCSATGMPPNPPYVFPVQRTIQPYLDLANFYGWANYMFQTNEGPSFPAHQFLFGGTSAPVWPSETFADYFVADNGGGMHGCPFSVPGIDWVDPSGDPSFNYPTPKKLGVNSYECYDHNTMVTTQDGPTGAVSPRMDKAGMPITWTYYAQSPTTLWDAPEADPQTCYGLSSAPAGNPGCIGSEFNHVVFPGPAVGESAPVFNDIGNCKLAKITWITPDDAWSDHPKDLKMGAKGYPALGPSWVADIVDAIGQSGANSGGKCDYWKTEPTAIFITWDDWGGFFDHVPPPAVYVGDRTTSGKWECTTADAPNGWGCGYVYGFRVPLLVVSPYTKARTVSGALNPLLPFPPKYPRSPCWEHDFGSILAFTEHNFYPVGSQSIAPSSYSYADTNTLDRECMGQTVVPLWEFFNSSAILPFTPISAPYAATFFQNYYATKTADGSYPMPTAPDDDGDEE